jgi:hypothetical protein
MIEWLQKWYVERCNGAWEHEYGIKIETLDNPGWTVTIDLSYTHVEDLEIPYSLNEVAEDQWIGYSVEKKKFVGASGPAQLNELIGIFKEIWETHRK